GVASVDRGHALGKQASVSTPRSRRGLWPRLPPLRSAHRYRQHRHTHSIAPCECSRRESHWDTSARVSGPHIALDERHLSSVLAEFVRYYSQDRPHRTLALQPPEMRLRPVTGLIRSRAILNGLHHAYERTP